MLSNLKEQLADSVAASLTKIFPSSTHPVSVDLEIPNDKNHGDLSTNIALKSTKIFKKSPLLLATEFRDVIQEGINTSPLKEKIEKVGVEKPGFINFYLSKDAVYDILNQVFEQQDDFGRSAFGKKQKMQIEFVSANPTGPLSVAHARQAVVGDALANILNFVGFDAQKEYYVNDEGNQINLLGTSIQCRALEHFGEDVSFPENGYQGDYIKDIASKFIEENQIKNASQLKEKTLAEFSHYGVNQLLDCIKTDLSDFGVDFDTWIHQSRVAGAEHVQSLLHSFQEKGFIYEKEGALWFKSTDYGDDKDRVVKKSDGTYTYLAPDMVYHQDKFARGFEKVVNIWGPDHHGYIPRLKAAVNALGHEEGALQVLIVQLATIYREGKPVSMSTRRGEYISLREVMDEVGVDAARFFFLMRHINVHLDFDLELAKKETPENPVYYIQYAHARIHSIVKKAEEAGLSARTSGFKLLREDEELDLIKKIGAFPDMLLLCQREMDPFALVSYLQELAAHFHKFYDQHRVVDPENADLSRERLALIDACRIVLANGLRLLGINAPKRM